MASYDGSLKFDTKIDAAGFNKGVSKLKSIGTGAVKAIGVGIAAAGAAITALVASSVKTYAAYEQLVGGVDTLFKESSDRVQEYANKAYQTAGLSANQYMEQVTSFAASLMQSLDNDTQAAADKANQAIIDMSDNANKMGTSIDRIQDAYQGFAKQNFTMLDNLKLGYGGTKTEMERLLADAKKISGIKYDINSYADIVDAIHVIQTEMGITGTTALEASTTIQGSLLAVKAAWENLMIGFADDTQSSDDLISNFSESLGAAFDNLVPRIIQTINGIVKAIPELANVIIDNLPEIIESTLPALVTAATDLIVGIADALPGIITVITDTLPTLIGKIVDSLPVLIPALIDGVVALIVGIADALPEIIVAIIDELPTIIESICDALIENIPILIEGALQLVLGLVEALPDIITSLIDALPDIIMMIVEVIIDNIPLFIEATIEIVFAIIVALPEIFLSLIESVVNLIMTLVESIKEKWPEFKEAAKEWFEKLIEGIEEKWEDVKTQVTGLWDDFVGWCSDVGPKLREAGEEIINDLWEGLKSAWESVKSWFSDAWDNLTGNSTPNITIKTSKRGLGGSSDGGFATGLDYVPFDGFTATLHKGEMVVPAYDAATLRASKGVSGYYADSYKPMSVESHGGDVNVTQNIYAQKQSPAAILKEARWQQERAVMIGV